MNIWNRIKPVLRGLALVLTGLAIGLGIFLANARVIGRDPLPMPFGIGLATVTSGSMRPALQVNDLVMVRKTDKYAVGDIVVWQNGSGLVVHRVISMDRKNVITKGDANLTADAPVDKRSVRGRVILRLPMAGALMMQPIVLPLLLLIAVMLIEVPLWKRKREDRQKIEELRSQIEDMKKQ